MARVGAGAPTYWSLPGRNGSSSGSQTLSQLIGVFARTIGQVSQLAVTSVELNAIQCHIGSPSHRTSLFDDIGAAGGELRSPDAVDGVHQGPDGRAMRIRMAPTQAWPRARPPSLAGT